MTYIAPEKLTDFLRQLLDGLEKDPPEVPLCMIFVHQVHETGCNVRSWTVGPDRLYEHLWDSVANAVEERRKEIHEHGKEKP